MVFKSSTLGIGFTSFVEYLQVRFPVFSRNVKPWSHSAYSPGTVPWRVRGSFHFRPLGPVNHRAVGSAFSVWTGCPHPVWTSGWPSERFIYLTPDSKFSIHLSKNPEGKIFMLGNEFAVMERCGSKQSKTGERGCAARSLLAGMTRN